MKIRDNFGFYAILTDPLKGYEYVANLLAEEGVCFVQLRDKKKSKYKILKIAEKLTKIFEESSSKLIINDHVDIAMDSGASGVHLGQDDMDYNEARSILGESYIIGVSTHNLEQTKEANRVKPDYIGVGPVYKTPTKEIADPILGLDTMRSMVELSIQPAVCIGGISIERLPDIISSGAKNFSMVRPICSVEDPKKSIRIILEKERELKKDNTKLFQ